MMELALWTVDCEWIIKDIGTAIKVESGLTMAGAIKEGEETNIQSPEHGRVCSSTSSLKAASSQASASLPGFQHQEYQRGTVHA